MLVTRLAGARQGCGDPFRQGSARGGFRQRAHPLRWPVSSCRAVRRLFWARFDDPEKLYAILTKLQQDFAEVSAPSKTELRTKAFQTGGGTHEAGNVNPKRRRFCKSCKTCTSEHITLTCPHDGIRSRRIFVHPNGDEVGTTKWAVRSLSKYPSRTTYLANTGALARRNA